jgi:hypothetical protein
MVQKTLQGLEKECHYFARKSFFHLALFVCLCAYLYTYIIIDGLDTKIRGANRFNFGSISRKIGNET